MKKDKKRNTKDEKNEKKRKRKQQQRAEPEVAIGVDSAPPATPQAPVPAGTRSAGQKARLTEMVPVRFDRALIDEVRRRADTDGHTVSAWIRRAVEREVQRTAQVQAASVQAAASPATSNTMVAPP